MNTIYPWKVFLRVAEEKSFRKAAAVLNVSPSAVSHIIQKIEEENGFFLFTRNRNEVELTPNGKLLISYVRQMMNACDSLDQKLMSIRNIRAGEVRIAGFNSACAMWVPEILKRFAGSYPDVRVKVFQQGDLTIRRMIDNGEVDLAFLSQDMAGEYDFLPLHRTPLVCLAPRGFVPRNGEAVTAEDIKTSPLVLQADGYDTEMKRYMDEADIRANAVYRIEVDSTCHEYVERGLGLCITPRMTFQCNPKNVREWPLYPQIYRIIGLVTVYPDFITPAAGLLKKEIIDYMKESGLYDFAVC